MAKDGIRWKKKGFAPDVKKFQWSKVPFWIREEQLFGTEVTNETEVKEFFKGIDDENDPDNFFSEFE